jgi:glycosyltransferase involved in cell wall biosynthesis
MTGDKKTICVIYPYFFPGFRAGGPVQSLVNVIIALGDRYDFRVITSAFDFKETKPYSSVALDRWNHVALSDKIHTQVYYHSSHKISKQDLQKILSHRTDIVFINGLFTSWSTLPLYFNWRGQLQNASIIVSARGMLQPGALASNSLQKKVFISALKIFGWLKGVTWHATNTQEVEDVLRVIGKNAKVIVAENIPKPPVVQIQPIRKNVGELRLIYLSLIAEKKNLLLLIRAVKKLSGKIVLDIYGPIKDTAYWQSCQLELKEVPSNISIQYCGEVQPEDVQTIIAGYHTLVSLTKGENFGHALYESLSVARPLITSQFTPWQNLQQNQAGWNLDIEQEEKISLVLHQIAETDDATWKKYCEGAWKIAKEYYFNSNFVSQYKTLFGNE